MDWSDIHLGSSTLALFVACACGTSTDDASAPESSSTSAATAGSTEASETGTATQPTTEPASTGSTSSTTEQTSTTGTTDSQTTDSQTTGGPPEIDCEGRCAEQAACGPDAELNCLTNCVDTQSAADWVGEACGAAYLAFQDCQTLRTCEQIEQGTGCETQLEGVAEACGPLAPAGCQAVCPKWIDCGLADPTFCTANCALSVGLAAVEAGQACAEALDGAYTCEADLTCDDDPAQACSKEHAAVDKACGQ